MIVKVLFQHFVLKMLNFGYFVLIWWQNGKKNKKSWVATTLSILVELPIVWLIIRSDNILNIHVDGALQYTVHNLLTQNQNMLKFWITWTSTDWWHRKMMLESGNSPLISHCLCTKYATLGLTWQLVLVGRHFFTFTHHHLHIFAIYSR